MTENINPAQAKALSEQGAILIDIRSRASYDNKHIDRALSIPLDELKNHRFSPGQTVIFSCMRGMSTAQNADFLQSCACDCARVCLLEGGLNAWEQCGFPVESNPAAPLDIMRQVRIAAGIFVLLGVLLGFTLSPWFFAICALVGAGLVFAGLTGFCGMASLLMTMPWNRKSTSTKKE